MHNASSSKLYCNPTEYWTWEVTTTNDEFLVFECAANERDDIHFKFVYAKCHKTKRANLLLLLNRRPDACNITNHNYIVKIATSIPFCRWRSWMSPLPINDKLVVVPSMCGIQVKLLHGVRKGLNVHKWITTVLIDCDKDF